jgi:hypothetical protein
MYSVEYGDKNASSYIEVSYNNIKDLGYEAQDMFSVKQYCFVNTSVGRIWSFIGNKKSLSADDLVAVKFNINPSVPCAILIKNN